MAHFHRLLLLGDVREHLPHLLHRHALAAREVLDLGAVVVLGERRVELVGVPGHLDVVPVLPGAERRLESALADEAPRARHV